MMLKRMQELNAPPTPLPPPEPPPSRSSGAEDYSHHNRWDFDTNNEEDSDYYQNHYAASDSDVGFMPNRHYNERYDNNSDSNSDTKDKFWDPAGADLNWAPAFLDPSWAENYKNYIDIDSDSNSNSDDGSRGPASSVCNRSGDGSACRWPSLPKHAARMNGKRTREASTTSEDDRDGNSTAAIGVGMGQKTASCPEMMPPFDSPVLCTEKGL